MVLPYSFEFSLKFIPVASPEKSCVCHGCVVGTEKEPVDDKHGDAGPHVEMLCVFGQRLRDLDGLNDFEYLLYTPFLKQGIEGAAGKVHFFYIGDQPGGNK